MSAIVSVSEAYSSRPSSASAVASPFQDNEALAAFDRIGKVVSFRRDEPLFFEGDAAAHCFKVVTGAVRSCRVLADGRRHVADFFLPGDFIAFEADTTYRFTAEAVADTTLMRYPRSGIEHMMAAQPRLGKSLLALLCRNLWAAQQRMLLLGRKNAVERIASFLVMMADRGDDGEHVVLPMTRGDIADYLGLTMETVSRVFTQLKNQRLIRLNRASDVWLKDIDALEDLAEAA